MSIKDEGKQSHSVNPADKNIIYDSGTIKVLIFASLIIVLAVILTGSMSYLITRNAVVDKLKTQDLVFIVDSITAKIDGRLERAKETSLILARDPMIIKWVAGKEQDATLGEYAQARINSIAEDYDYANAFVVSATTNNYWAEGFKVIQVMSPAAAGDKWFFDGLKSKKSVYFNLDYNSGRKDTFVFVDTLVGDVNQPIAIAGVGLSLKSIADEFRNYKFGEKSSLWLIDSSGKIHLSDNFNHNGQYLNDYLPTDVVAQVLTGIEDATATSQTLEYTNEKGETIDLVYRATKSTDWKVVFQIPRSESIAILGSIKLNTAVSGFIALVLMVFVFYIVSNRIANPLKRALLLTAEMEKKVDERTRELVDKNQKIIDSIEYAQRLQESILASTQELQDVLGDYFILWKPRDVVGGDFYWVRRLDAHRSLIAVADCTGHGVPGAFMTMAVNSVLKSIVDQGNVDPSLILAELNRRMKEILHRNHQDRITDDGLDIGICYVENNKMLTFAGAKIPLYICRGNKVEIIKGDRRSIGYRRSSDELEFTNHYWEVQSGDRFYLTTDGFIDQNGGEKDYPFGRKKLIEIIREQSGSNLTLQRNSFESALRLYMGNELQRDDITLIGFVFK